MKKNMMKIGAGMLTIAMVVSTVPMNVEAAKKTEQPKALKIGVMSDTHYFSESLYSKCEDFEIAMNSDRKMLKESGAIIDSTLEEMVKDKPDIVMVSGDLTKDGEETNHREFAEKLEDAQKKLPNTKFYVINGNHDINNPNGKDFSSGVAEDTDTTTVEEFREIYKNFGYDNSTEQYKPEGTDAGSLSYVAHPADGYTLIAVDSCKYSADQTASGQDVQETGGVIGEDLLNWISKEAQEAKDSGDVVMVLEHHGVVPHFSQEPVVMKDYLVDNYETVQERYADAGVSYVFTGHMHANDIAEYTSKKGNKLYDIETGSLVTYPSLFRSVTVQAGTDKTQDGNSFVSEMKKPGEVNYKEFDTGEIKTIKDLTAYAKELTLSKEVICTMINEGVLTPTLESLEQNGNVKGLLSQIMGVEPEQVSGALGEILTGILPKTKEEGIHLELKGFQFIVYYSSDDQAIKLEQKVKSTFETVEDGVLVIPTEDGDVVRITLPEEIQNVLVQSIQEQENVTQTESAVQDEVEVPIESKENNEEVSEEVAENLTETVEQIEESAPIDTAASSVEAATEERGLFDPIALKVTDAKLVATIDGLIGQLEGDFLKGGSVQRIVEKFIGNILDGKVDEEHTVFDVVETVYQLHLAGNENREQWLTDAILKIQEGEMLPKIIKQSLTDLKEILVQELSKLNVSLKNLVEADNNSLATNAAVGLISQIQLNGGDLIKGVENIGAFIPDEALMPINEIAYNVAESMSNDENFKDDLEANITIEGVKAWDKEEITTPEENNGTTAPGGNNGTTSQNGNMNGNVKPSQNTPVKTGEQAPIAFTFVFLIGSASVLLLLKLRKNK